MIESVNQATTTAITTVRRELFKKFLWLFSVSFVDTELVRERAKFEF